MYLSRVNFPLSKINFPALPHKPARRGIRSYMKLSQQILSELGADTSAAVTLVFNFAAYASGVKEIAEFTPERVVLLRGSGKVEIGGEDLCVYEYFGGDVIIRGKVLSAICSPRDKADGADGKGS